MKCPICDTDMRIADREGVEIDYCPQCRGVWLDRGELEKLIARVESAGYGERGRRDHDDDDHDHHHDDRRASKVRDEEHYEDAHDGKIGYKYRGKRKEGFLSQLFDVFGD